MQCWRPIASGQCLPFPRRVIDCPDFTHLYAACPRWRRFDATAVAQAAARIADREEIGSMLLEQARNRFTPALELITIPIRTGQNFAQSDRPSAAGRGCWLFSAPNSNSP